MGNILIAGVMTAQATGLFSQGFVWAVLFGVLLVAVVAYAICRWSLSRERQKMEAELQKMRAEHRTELEETKQGVLSGVSRDLLTPITLIISPLQQLAFAVASGKYVASRWEGKCDASFGAASRCRDDAGGNTNTRSYAYGQEGN